ncbi:MAG TPA: hypothetical protein VHW23_15140 [Kofleriaceae bacterium]|jgi:hypothetical protein|nr:hypothetical protein [Kofleriaceae bacterium]
MNRHLLLAALWLCPLPAAAQNTSDTKAAANALFDQGKRLIAAGDVDGACAKFEASMQLLDQLGVRLNVADCHERQGRTATAWAEFSEAASQADRRGDSRVAYARQRAEALEPRLTRLAISMPPASRPPGLVVRRDNVVVPGEAFGTPLPVDPGSHTITASATGDQTWSTRIEARKPGEVITIEIPRLTAMPRSAEPDPRRPRRRLGLGVGAGGIGLVGVSIALGLEARSKWGSVGAHCDANHVCDAEGVSINHRARLYGNAGTVVAGVGVAALITGAVLYVTAPAARSVIEHARVEVDGGSSVQVGFAGRF